MTVSIITVSFNSEHTIRATIESVLAQEFPDIQYIIVDGGSTDGTLSIIDEYRDRIAHVISERDHGIYDAMNKGMRVASGEVVAFLNSDDVYADSGVVKRLIHAMDRSKSDVVYADLVMVDKDDLGRVVRYYDSSRFSPRRLRYGWMPAHPTFFARRRLFKTWGGFSLDYRIAADFEMMVRLFHRAKVTYAYLPEVVVRMRTGGVSTRGLRSSWILNWEIVRACRENGLDSSLPLLLMKIPEKMLGLLQRPKALNA